MPTIEAIIRAKAENLGAFAEAKGAAAGLGGEFQTLEQKAAAASGAHVNLANKARATGAAHKEAATGIGAFHQQVEQSGKVLGPYGEQLGGMTGKLSALGALGFTPMGMAALGATAAVGVGIEVGGKAIEVSERHEKAERSLKQAVDERGLALGEASDYTAGFIKKNQAFIKSQSEVTESYAALLRANLPLEEAQKDLERALDLSALKGISLAEATSLIVKAEMGRTRGLIDLGINMKELNQDEAAAKKSHEELAKASNAATKAQDELAKAQRTLTEEEDRLTASRKLSSKEQELLRTNAQKLLELHRITKPELDQLEDKHNKVTAAQQHLADATRNVTERQAAMKDETNAVKEVLGQFDQRVGGARDTVTDLERKQNTLNGRWEEFATKIGPPLSAQLATVLGNLTDIWDQNTKIAAAPNPFDKFGGYADMAIKALSPVGNLLGDIWQKVNDMRDANLHISATADSSAFPGVDPNNVPAGTASGDPYMSAGHAAGFLTPGAASQPFWAKLHGGELVLNAQQSQTYLSRGNGANAAELANALKEAMRPVRESAVGFPAEGLDLLRSIAGALASIATDQGLPVNSGAAQRRYGAA